MINTIRKLYYRFLQEFSNQSREKYARIVGTKIGKDCRIYSTNFGSEPYLIYIGDHVTITGGVQFITHDGGLWVLRDKIPQADFIRPIIVHNNSFIGANAIILPGVVIGPNSVVGAGAVVTKNVPPGTIAVGVPARVISTIDQYCRHIDKDFYTHKMSQQEKKEYLLNYFGKTPEEWQKKLDDLSARQQRGQTERWDNENE